MVLRKSFTQCSVNTELAENQCILTSRLKVLNVTNPLICSAIDKTSEKIQKIWDIAGDLTHLQALK